MECTKCGAPDELAKLFDVISGEGIVKICQRCLSYENSPIIRKPTEEQINSVNKSEPMYKRLSNAAGLDPEKHKANLEFNKKQDLVKKQEVTLRDLVEQKFDSFVKEEDKEKREDLVDNFHWTIMRARRSKKMTVTQLAKEVGESERSIKLAEQGVLPEDNYNLAIRLEELLGISILKPEVAEELNKVKRKLGFDKFTTKAITIADLQKMKEESTISTDLVEPVEQKTPYWKRFLNRLTNKNEVPETPIVVMEEKNETVDEMEFEEPRETHVEFSDTSFEMSEEVKQEEPKKTGDISQKDIDDIIFGRR